VVCSRRCFALAEAAYPSLEGKVCGWQCRGWKGRRQARRMRMPGCIEAATSLSDRHFDAAGAVSGGSLLTAVIGTSTAPTLSVARSRIPMRRKDSPLTGTLMSSRRPSPDRSASPYLSAGMFAWTTPPTELRGVPSAS